MFTSRNKGQDIRKCIYWFETFERNVSWGQVLCPHTSAFCYSICLEYLTSIFQMLSRCLNPSDPFLDLTDIIISYADSSSGKESTCKQNMQETWVPFLGWEDPLQEEMAIHFSILAREIAQTEECGGLQSMGLQRIGRNWAHVDDDDMLLL